MLDSLPHNDDLERDVLGAALFDAEAQTAVTQLLTVDAFYSESHRLIFQTIVRLNHRQVVSDLVATATALRDSGKLDAVGGAAYLAAMVNGVYTTANVEHHAKRLSDLAGRRKVIRCAMEAIAGAQDEGQPIESVIERTERGLSGAGGFDPGKGLRRFDAVLHSTYEAIERRQSFDGEDRILSFGYRDIDDVAVGLAPGEMVLLAARPSMGKTALAGGIAAAVAGVQRRPVVLFSLEMTSESIAQRLLGSKSGVNGMTMRTAGAMKDHHWSKVVAAMGRMGDWPLYIDDGGEVTSQQMRAKCRHIQREAGAIGLIIVDHIGLMEPEGKSENRNQEISRISRGLKLMAKEFDCPVLALSQLNRAVEQRTNKRPMLSDLRESGSLEQDADKVIFVYRDAYYNPESEHGDKAEVIVAKHRDGPTGTVKLFYNRETASFQPLGFENEPDTEPTMDQVSGIPSAPDILNTPEPLTKHYGASA